MIEQDSKTWIRKQLQLARQIQTAMSTLSAYQLLSVGKNFASVDTVIMEMDCFASILSGGYSFSFAFI